MGAMASACACLSRVSSTATTARVLATVEAAFIADETY